MTAAVAIMAGCGGITGINSDPSGPGPEATEAKLRQIATTTSEPIYYLGSDFRGWPLEDAIISTTGTGVEDDTTLDPGQSLSVLYGADCDGGDCYWHVEVSPQDMPFDGSVVGCSRLEPLHGVPTVAFADGGSVVLFTGELELGVSAVPGDLAIQAAAELRKVGESAPVGTLPPPPASKLKLIDAACGAHPGDHGPELTNEPGLTELPDFTVPRLGGGELRWTDYLGKPVVVVVGDVFHVAPAVRRLAGLTSGGTSPPVIGLIWDPTSKEQTLPPADIEREAGGPLPVPVGYPATYPAVWITDSLEPGQLGVIAFFKNTGQPVTALPTDASDDAIRDAIQQLR